MPSHPVRALLASLVAAACAAIAPAAAANAAPPPVPDGFEVVDLIDDSGFERSTAGFEPVSPLDGSVAQTAFDPIAGAHSLAVTLDPFGRITHTHDYPFEAGPRAASVTVQAKLRVNGADPADRRMRVCAIAYYEGDPEPRSTCSTHAVDPDRVVDVSVTQDTDGRQLDRAIFQLERGDTGTVRATLDEARLLVVQPGSGLPPVPDGFERVDLIADGGFEASTAGFEPFSPLDGSVAQIAADPIAGERSLGVTIGGFGRIMFTHEFPFEGGPLAASLSVKARVRVDGADPADRELGVCSIAYFEGDPEPQSTCDTFPVADDVADVFLALDTDGRQLDRAIFQLYLGDSGTVRATVDDAHLFVVQPLPEPEPEPEPTPDLPPVPDGFERVDLLDDGGFEASTGGFEPVSPLDGAVAQTATDPIAGARSLDVAIGGFGRVTHYHDHPFEGGPHADSVTVAGRLRVDGGSAGRRLSVCAIAYFQGDPEPRSSCGAFRIDPSGAVDVVRTLDAEGRQLDASLFQLALGDTGTIRATLDDAHLYVVQPVAP